MSAPIVELTDDERAAIAKRERMIGDLYAEIQTIRRDAALRDGIAPEWLARH